ncbi:MAG: hypothetical protein ABH871_01660 [Pseudomonadota bacterium]
MKNREKELLERLTAEELMDLEIVDFSEKALSPVPPQSTHSVKEPIE